MTTEIRASRLVSRYADGDDSSVRYSATITCASGAGGMSSPWGRPARAPPTGSGLVGVRWPVCSDVSVWPIRGGRDGRSIRRSRADIRTPLLRSAAREDLLGNALVPTEGTVGQPRALLVQAAPLIVRTGLHDADKLGHRVRHAALGQKLFNQIQVGRSLPAARLVERAQ